MVNRTPWYVKAWFFLVAANALFPFTMLVLGLLGVVK